MSWTCAGCKTDYPDETTMSDYVTMHFGRLCQTCAEARLIVRRYTRAYWIYMACCLTGSIGLIALVYWLVLS